MYGGRQESNHKTLSSQYLYNQLLHCQHVVADCPTSTPVPGAAEKLKLQRQGHRPQILTLMWAAGRCRSSARLLGLILFSATDYWYALVSLFTK